eukprot:593814_1
MEVFLKQQLVSSYIRGIESTLAASYLIPSSILWLVSCFIEDDDISTYWLNTMHREIIHIQIGQCGNLIGNSFWSSLLLEHKLGKDGVFTGDLNKNNYRVAENLLRLDKIHVYFQETTTKRYVPRACCIDLDPSIVDNLRASPVGMLFKPDNVCFGMSSAGNNWAKGYFTEGAELIDETMDIIRREVEACNSLQAFQLLHSIGGGAGSGMGSLLLYKLRDEYPDRIVATFTVYPSPKVSDVVVEPYNAILSMHHLLQHSDETFVIDNEALFNIAHNVLKIRQPKYAELNWVISMVMSGVTCSLRFGGTLNCDLRKMGVNLVPFPRLHFLLIAHAPLFAPGQGQKVKLTSQEIENQMWSSRNVLANIKAEDGKYMSATCMFRGAVSNQEVDDEVAKVQQKMADDFVTWIPNNIKSAHIVIPPEDTSIAGTFVANTTAMKAVFQRVSAQFAKMFKRKAFLHWYKGEGMDEMEFQEADKNVRDLITEYQDKQDAIVDWDDDDDEDDDESDDEEEDGIPRSG